MLEKLFKRLWLELILAFDLFRSFFEPVMAYRIGCLVIVKRRYRRPWPTTLRDGTVLNRGDKIIKIHMKLFLPRFPGKVNELNYARYLSTLLVSELPRLADLIRKDPSWYEFKAITGQSHIVGRFTEKAGFETQSIPDWWRYVVDGMSRGAMLLADPSPRCLLKIIKPAGVRPPRECWASRESFLRFYPDTGAEPPFFRRLFKYF